jgi:hypothetical protein
MPAPLSLDWVNVLCLFRYRVMVVVLDCVIVRNVQHSTHNLPGMTSAIWNVFERQCERQKCPLDPVVNPTSDTNVTPASRSGRVLGVRATASFGSLGHSGLLPLSGCGCDAGDLPGCVGGSYSRVGTSSTAVGRVARRYATVRIYCSHTISFERSVLTPPTVNGQ